MGRRIAVIRAAGLRFSYGNGDREALAGLDLAVEPGERVLISGPTGCGKSTLGWVLCGAAPGLIPGRLSGRVEIRGRPVEDRSPRDLSRDLGFLLQNVEHQIFTDRVADEIAFGLENFGVPEADMDDRIAEALDRVSARHLTGRALATLSAGERQRVVLAALLVLDPPILMLDEPMAFLDRNAQATLLDLTTSLTRSGGTVLIFEHRRDIVRPAVDREVAMDRGCVSASPAAATDFPAVRPGPMGEARLVFDGVAAAWPGREGPLFTGASFSVRSGESVALLGENGSGKTTLLSMAMGLVKPASGVILNRGRPVGKTSPSELARRTAFLFQHPDHQLYLARVSDEVRMQTGDRKAADGELAALGLNGLEDRHPRSLSMGQKRRLTIAAALARRPRLLLMDEPSVGQDDDSLGRILRRLDRFVREGGALLTATHDLRVAQALAHRTLILQNGRLSAEDREAARIFFDDGPRSISAGPLQPAHEAPIHRSDSDNQRVLQRHEGRPSTTRATVTRHRPC